MPLLRRHALQRNNNPTSTPHKLRPTPHHHRKKQRKQNQKNPHHRRELRERPTTLPRQTQRRTRLRHQTPHRPIHSRTHRKTRQRHTPKPLTHKHQPPPIQAQHQPPLKKRTVQHGIHPKLPRPFQHHNHHGHIRHTQLQRHAKRSSPAHEQPQPTPTRNTHTTNNTTGQKKRMTRKNKLIQYVDFYLAFAWTITPIIFMLSAFIIIWPERVLELATAYKDHSPAYIIFAAFLGSIILMVLINIARRSLRHNILKNTNTPRALAGCPTCGQELRAPPSKHEL